MPPSRLLSRYRYEESGAIAIEYALLATMVAIALVGMLAAGGAIEALYETVIAVADALLGASNGDG